MNQKPTVSVITVVQNGERYLSTAIESILAQAWQPDEVLVIDGASTDRTAEIAQSYPKVRYSQQQGEGLAHARNTGIEDASSEWIAFLDHDDYWTPQKLELQMSCLANRSEYQYSYAEVQLFLEPGCQLRAGFPLHLLEQPQIGRTPGTLIARRSLFDRIGQFNPQLRIGCDAEWFARVKDAKIPAAFVPEVLLYKRVHQTNLSANVAANRKELFQVVKQSLDRQRQFKED